ncbi:MAG: LLM class flavin-dependent oxidoreductase [Candidatus Bathyarchaeia archaeon]
MKFGISTNVDDTLEASIAKGLAAEISNLDYLWISDLPNQRYPPAVAAAVASRTRKIRIGLGLISPILHPPIQVASFLTTLIEFYGERFELCIGPGDRDQLFRVGIDLNRIGDISKVMLEAKDKIVKNLQSRGLECRVWLGAQGPRMLRAASRFDGVLLNYSDPEMLGWALREIGRSNESKMLTVGIFAPSYIYMDFKPEIYQALRFASGTVALGASDHVLKRFGIYESIAQVRKQYGLEPFNTPILRNLPLKVIERFGILKSQNEFSSYIKTLKGLGVEHVVFAYPQAISVETIKELGEILRKSN